MLTGIDKVTQLPWPSSAWHCVCVPQVLLRCDKGVANYSDRTLLKNLGHWLGLLTLAKNKPILFREMDVKGLIYESYHKGAQELLYIIPFVAKIIESAAKSRVCCYLFFSFTHCYYLLIWYCLGVGLRYSGNQFSMIDGIIKGRHRDVGTCNRAEVLQKSTTADIVFDRLNTL